MVLFLFLVYLFMKVVLLGFGIGIGFLLHAMLPAVDLGMGILIGVLATAAAVHFFTRLMSAIQEWGEEVSEQEIGKKIYSLGSIAARKRTRLRNTP